MIATAIDLDMVDFCSIEKKLSIVVMVLVTRLVFVSELTTLCDVYTLPIVAMVFFQITNKFT